MGRTERGGGEPIKESSLCQWLSTKGAHTPQETILRLEKETSSFLKLEIAWLALFRLGKILQREFVLFPDLIHQILVD